jgi:hypothetical protein
MSESVRSSEAIHHGDGMLAVGRWRSVGHISLNTQTAT